MMPIGKLVRLVAKNTVRNRRHFLLSTFGIVVGIGSFVFFLSLSEGVRNVVLGDIFPLERVEVIAPKTHIAGRTLAKRLDEGVVERIRSRPEVKEAVPRMTLAFPASGNGWFEGKEIKFEVGGFCDGIDPSFARDEPFAELFQDWETPERTADLASCGPGNPCRDKSRYYCDKSDFRCHHRVPVLVSRTLLEIYNGGFAGSHGLPAIGALEEFVAKQGGLDKMRFDIGLGSTYVSGSNVALKAGPREVEAFLVGISDKAIPIGMTVPIQYVERWNREYVGDEAASTYSSVIVMLKDKDNLAGFSGWLKEGEKLELQDSQGERFAMVIFIVTTLFLLISFVIVAISAINIAHNFFMQVSERRREIGVMRAVGATSADVRRIILGEAAVIGVVGGVIGIVLAVWSGFAIDAASRRWLPNFPFKPDTYFDFRWWILVGGLGFAVLFCVIGGYLPARKASRMEPAQALAAQ